MAKLPKSKREINRKKIIFIQVFLLEVFTLNSENVGCLFLAILRLNIPFFSLIYVFFPPIQGFSLLFNLFLILLSF